MFHNYWNQFKQFLMQFDDIHILLWVVVLTTFIFLFMHHKRDKPILKNISIMLGFLPVLTHELGHALMCSFTRGRVDDIHMVLTAKHQQNTQTQGFAVTAPKNRLSAVLTGFFGYIFPPLIFLSGVWLITKGYSIVFISILVLMMCYYFIKTKQKYIAIVPFGLMIYALYEIFMGHHQYMQMGIDVVISIYLGLLLGEVIQSIVITAQVNFKINYQEWDGSMLRRLTGIPATVWFCLWTIIDIILITYACQMFIN